MHLSFTVTIVIFLLNLDTILSRNFHQNLIGTNFKESQANFKQHLNTLIINGVTSPQRLFYARVRYARFPGFCGATILEGRFVITAAHCVFYLHRKTDSYSCFVNYQKNYEQFWLFEASDQLR